jgi:hypothetical protein
MVLSIEANGQLEYVLGFQYDVSWLWFYIPGGISEWGLVLEFAENPGIIRVSI